MEGDAAPGDQPERASIRKAAAAERQNRKPELGARQQIDQHISAGFEINPDNARDQARRNSENDCGGQGDADVDDEQCAQSLMIHAFAR